MFTHPQYRVSIFKNNGYIKSNLHDLNLKLKEFVDNNYMSFGVKFTSFSYKPDVGNYFYLRARWGHFNGIRLLKTNKSVSYASNGYEIVPLTV
jgi:hypothetical protein